MLMHRGTVTLETERLILRKFEAGDAEAAFNNWLKDPEVSKFLSWSPHTTLHTTREILNKWIECYDNLSNYNWTIIPKDYGRVIGHLTLVELSDKNERCSIGYCIGKNFWNKGYVTEAFEAVIAFLFDEINMNRIEAKHDTENPASGRVMEKVGMKYEGTLHQYRMRKDGTFGSSALYSITRDNYNKK